MRIEHHVDAEDIATALCAYPGDHPSYDDTKSDFEQWFREEIRREGVAHFYDIDFYDIDHPIEDEYVQRRMSDWFPEFDLWKEHVYE